MDPLLRQLLVSGVGLSINNFYAGGFLHVDDIGTLATSEASLRHQIELVKVFTDQNLLNLTSANVKSCYSQHNQAPVLSQHVRWMDWFYLLEMPENAWVIG